ncbi:MAG: arsenate reductase ArsC [Planctomycetota bacterium]
MTDAARKPAVMFVCTHNSSRSQMAEGMLRHHAGDKFEVYSSGVEPGKLRDEAVAAMQDLGVDISSHRAEGIDAYMGKVDVDYLITVCSGAEQSCPAAWPGVKARFFWDLPDPSVAEGDFAARVARYIEVRDMIKTRMDAWLEKVEATATA